MSEQTLSTQRPDVPELAQWVLKTYKNWAENRQPLEDKWQANRDAFRGEDDVSWVDPDSDTRPDATDEGTSTTFRGKTDWHSRHTIRLTKQKVMTAFALVSDASLQGGRVPFLLKLSGELAVNAEDLPEDAAQEMDNQIQDMTQRIQGQFARCGASRQAARAMLCAATYGRAWCKFRARTYTSRRMVAAPPQPVLDQATGQPAMGPDGKPVLAPEQWNVEKVGEVVPGFDCISVWDIFSDLEAEDKRRSGGIIHRQYLCPRELRAASREGKGWDLAAVDRALKESAKQTPSQGDNTTELIPRLRDINQRKNTIRVLECWVQVPRDYADRYESQAADTGLTGGNITEAEASGDDIPCLVVLAGDEIVRFMRLEEGEPWPFYSIPWEEDIDEADTWGVADNLGQTQAGLNSAVRCFFDNKRLSASLLLGLKRRSINNPNWDGKIKPQMVLDVAEEARNIGEAVSAFVCPDVGSTLLPVIEMYRVLGDEEAMLPKIMSGAQEENQQTAREAIIRSEKAGKYMGAVVKNFDEYLFGPVVTDFYEWNMLDPAVTTGKGPYDVTPLGFTSFQDRIVRLQALQNILGIILGDPELRRMFKLADIMREVCKAVDLDPDQWMHSKQDMEALESQPNPAEVLALEGQKAVNEKTQAETAKTMAETEVLGERLKIDRAMAVKNLMAPPPQPNGTDNAKP